MTKIDFQQPNAPLGLTQAQWDELRCGLVAVEQNSAYNWFIRAAQAVCESKCPDRPNQYRAVQAELAAVYTDCCQAVEQCNYPALLAALALAQELELLAKEVYEDSMQFQMLMRDRYGCALH